MHLQVIVYTGGNVSTVLSVRVRKELKEEAERLGINIREVVEKALEESIERAKRELVTSALKAVWEELSKVPEDEWIRVIKESRRGR